LRQHRRRARWPREARQRQARPPTLAACEPGRLRCLDSVDTEDGEDARQQVRSSESAATDRRSARCIGMRRRQCTRQFVWRLSNHPLIP
jgi:hypothetical protein